MLKWKRAKAAPRTISIYFETVISSTVHKSFCKYNVNFFSNWIFHWFLVDISYFDCRNPIKMKKTIFFCVCVQVKCTLHKLLLLFINQVSEPFCCYWWCKEETENKTYTYSTIRPKNQSKVLKLLLSFVLLLLLFRAQEKKKKNMSCDRWSCIVICV